MIQSFYSSLHSLVVNVMQRDSIPSEVDYETRQGVYSICLQLARSCYTSYDFNFKVFHSLWVLLSFRKNKVFVDMNIRKEHLVLTGHFEAGSLSPPLGFCW